MGLDCDDLQAWDPQSVVQSPRRAQIAQNAVLVRVSFDFLHPPVARPWIYCSSCEPGTAYFTKCCIYDSSLKKSLALPFDSYCLNYLKILGLYGTTQVAFMARCCYIFADFWCWTFWLSSFEAFASPTCPRLLFSPAASVLKHYHDIQAYEHKPQAEEYFSNQPLVFLASVPSYHLV